MIPRLKPALGRSELLAALRPHDTGDIDRFEAAFAQLMGQQYALAFPYGRTGLMFLLESLGLKGKEVICPAYTCVVVPHAITYSGNVPVFVDCEQDGFNMDLDKAESAITENTGAIIATSLFGYPVDLDRLDGIRRRHPNISIVQDCAHSFAAEWKGRPVQKEGIAALFGLNISKTLTSIFGGMITTDDAHLYERLGQLRDATLRPADWKRGIRRLTYVTAAYFSLSNWCYGIVNRLERSGNLDRFVKYYDQSEIDMPRDYLRQMTGVEARVGSANILRYHEIIQRQRCAAMHYFKNLVDREDFKLPPRVSGATYSHFVVQVPDRRQWLEEGIRQGIQLGWLIEYCIPKMNAYGGHNTGDFSISGRYARTTINLPVWGGEKIARKVTRFISASILTKPMIHG